MGTSPAIAEVEVGVTDTADAPSRYNGNVPLLVSTLILGVLAFQLCASMVTPALPSIAAELGVDTTSVSQVSSLFFLASAVGGVFLSRWSDFIGRKKTFMIVMALLVFGTLLALFAPSLPILLLGRIFQGASGAAFQLAYVTLNENLSAKAFAGAIGAITAVNGGVGGLDGWWGGLLTENFGYQSIFVVILAVAILAWLAILAVVPNSKPAADTGSMDWAGASFLGLGLISLTYFMSQGPAAGWTHWTTVTLAMGAIAFFLAFWNTEKRVKTPMFPVEHMKSRQVWPVILTTLLALSSVFAVINFTIVLLSQDGNVGYGLDAGTASLMFLTPPALIGLASAPLSGWLAGRFGWIRIARVGIAIAIGALAVIALFADNLWVVFTMILVLGVAYNGMILTTINGLGVVMSPPEAPGALPGLNSAAFGIGASLGIAIVAPIIAVGTAAGYAGALWVSLGITVLALGAALLIKPRPGQTV